MSSFLQGGNPKLSAADMLKERAIRAARAKVYDKDGLPIMSKDAIHLACIENDGYESPKLNTKLYLHFKGFRKIENLEEFTELVSIFLESNGLTSLEGLETLTKLRCVFAQQNIISSIRGIENLKQLRTINLAQNRIKELDTGVFKHLTCLSTINLSKNRIDTVNGLLPLLECDALSNLDISSNDLEDAAVLSEVIYSIPKLSCLYLKGNPFVRTVKHYRKTLLCSIPRLAYLDDRPVFEMDRIAADAWKEGGVEGERAARKRHQEAKRNEDRDRRRKFTEWKAKRRAAREAEIAKAKAEGRELPPPRVFVRYETVEPAEEERLERIRSKATASSSSSSNSENVAAALGREFAQECGAKFDSEGNLVDEEKSDADVEPETIELPSAPQAPSAPSAGNLPLPLPTTDVGPEGNEDTTKVESDTALPAEPVQAEVEVEQVPDVDPEEAVRRARVAESMRIYRLGREERQNKAGEPVGKGGSSSQELILNASVSKASKIEVETVKESVQMTLDQRRKLAERVAEAEEEDDNYRASRSQFKAQARARIGERRHNPPNNKPAPIESKPSRRDGSGKWSSSVDTQLQNLVRKFVFDFNKVARALGEDFSPEDCRKRYASLDERSRRAESAPQRARAPTSRQREAPRRTATIPPARRQFDTNAGEIDTSSFDNLPVLGDGNGVPFPKLKPVTVDFSKIPSIKFDENDSEGDDDDTIAPVKIIGVGGLTTARAPEKGGASSKSESEFGAEAEVHPVATDFDGLD